MAATIYKLGINAISSDESITAFNEEFTQGNPVTPKDLKGNILVKDIKFNAQMYSPNSLEVVLSATEIQLEQYDDIRLSLYKSKTTYVAQNYYVVEKKFKITSSGANQREYILKAYSADYFLTIDKFCQAFTGKTLKDGIVVPTLQNSVSKNFNLFRTLAGKTSNDTNATKDATDYLVINQQNFDEASIIPYAVQYNESFYDFLMRMCNRDGEFLYFGADNKLHIGLEKKENTYSLTDSYVAEFIQIYNNEDTTNWVELDYLGKYKENGKDYLDTFNASNETEDTNLNSFCGVLAPEYLEDLSKQKEYRGSYCKVDDYFCEFSEITSFINMIALEATILDSLASLVKNEAVRWSHIGAWVSNNNRKYDDKFKYIYIKNEKEEVVQKERTYLYADGSRNNSSYKKYYNAQERAKSNQINLVVTGESFPNIGEKITLDGKLYVVYKVEVKFLSIDSNNYTQNYDLLLVGCESNGDAYPLPEYDKRIRKTSAMRAKVMDNFDPSRLGRVRVKFSWQKETDIKQDIEKKVNEENNWTPWIRVSTPMASDGAGFLFTPAEGDEVLVDFEDGNIEYPYVVGAFYNETNRPSVPSQSQTHGVVKSITSANGHHISFTDNAGLERYLANFVPFAKFASSFGEYDQKIFSGDNAKYFGGGFEISDYYGIYSITGSTHNRSINISSPYGDVSIDAFQGISINAPLGDVKIVGKNVSIEARNNLTLESGTNIQRYFKNKNNYLKIPGTIISTMNSTVGFDLSFLRTYIEVIFRPIGGTMLIKSNRYMRLEAGDGNTLPDNSVKGSVKQLTSPMPLRKTKLVNEKEKVVSVYNRIYSWCRNYNVAVEYANRELNDLEFIQNGNLRRTEDIIEEANQVDKNAHITAIRELLAYLEEQKATLNPDRIEGFPDIEKVWRDFKVIQFPSAKKIVYNYLKKIVNNDSSFSDLIYVHNLPSGDFPSDLNEYIEDFVEQAYISEPFTKILSIGDFYNLNDERTWETADKGAILFSDNKKTYYKIGDNGEFMKGQNLNYKDEFIALIDNVIEIE